MENRRRIERRHVRDVLKSNMWLGESVTWMWFVCWIRALGLGAVTRCVKELWDPLNRTACPSTYAARISVSVPFHVLEGTESSSSLLCFPPPSFIFMAVTNTLVVILITNNWTVALFSNWSLLNHCILPLSLPVATKYSFMKHHFCLSFYWDAFCIVQNATLLILVLKDMNPSVHVSWKETDPCYHP